MAETCVTSREATEKVFEMLNIRDIPIDDSRGVVIGTADDGIHIFVDDHISYRSFTIENDGDLKISRSGEGLNGNFTDKGVFTPDAVAKAKKYLEANLCVEEFKIEPYKSTIDLSKIELKPYTPEPRKVGIYIEHHQVPNYRKVQTELLNRAMTCSVEASVWKMLKPENAWLDSFIGCFGRK